MQRLITNYMEDFGDLEHLEQVDEALIKCSLVSV